MRYIVATDSPARLLQATRKLAVGCTLDNGLASARVQCPTSTAANQGACSGAGSGFGSRCRLVRKQCGPACATQTAVALLLAHSHWLFRFRTRRTAFAESPCGSALLHHCRTFTLCAVCSCPARCLKEGPGASACQAATAWLATAAVTVTARAGCRPLAQLVTAGHLPTHTPAPLARR